MHTLQCFLYDIDLLKQEAQLWLRNRAMHMLM